MKYVDPVIVLGLSFMVALCFVMWTALQTEPTVDEMLDFRAAVLKVQDAGK